MISTLANEGLFSGFSVCSRHDDVFNISHLLFVDDTLILLANLDHLRNLCCLFLCFEAVSSFED